MKSLEDKKKEVERLRNEVRALELLRDLNRRDIWLTVEKFKGRQLVEIKHFDNFSEAYQYYSYISMENGYTYKLNQLIAGLIK